MYKEIAENVLSDYSVNIDLLSDDEYLLKISWKTINKWFYLKDFNYVKAWIYIFNNNLNFNSKTFYKIIRRLNLFNDISWNLNYLLNTFNDLNNKEIIKWVINISIITKNNYFLKIYDIDLVWFDFKILNDFIENIISLKFVSTDFLNSLLSNNHIKHSIEILLFLLNNKTTFWIKSAKENYTLYSNILNINTSDIDIFYLDDIFSLKLYSIVKLTFMKKNETLVSNFLVSIENLNLNINNILKNFLKTYKYLKKEEVDVLYKIIEKLSKVTGNQYHLPDFSNFKSLYVNDDWKWVNEEKKWIESLIQKDTDKLLFLSESWNHLNIKLDYFARLWNLKLVMNFWDEKVLYIIEKKDFNREVLFINTELWLWEKSNNNFYEKINNVIYDFLQGKLKENSWKYFEIVNKNRFFNNKFKLYNNFHNEYPNEKLF